MPGSRTHDAVTLLLTAPAAAAAYAAGLDIGGSALVAASFLFGGLMFGPDLDILSKQHSRWGVLGFLWYPYRSFFKHRSRWSHGLLFGTLIRVIYFMGVATLLSFAATYLIATYSGSDLPRISELALTWSTIGEWVRSRTSDHFLPAIFAGLWSGAASHTLTDMAGSYVKTGRVTGFL